MSDANQYIYDYKRIEGIPMPATLPRGENPTRAHRWERFRAIRMMIGGNVVRGIIPTWLMSKRRIPKYGRIWVKDALPAVTRTWDSDAEFARQRVAGYDPKVIAALGPWDPAAWWAHMHLPDNLLSDILEGEDISLEQLVQAKRVFVCDYKAYLGLRAMPGRHFTAPVALFVQKPATARSGRALLPIAIWLRALDAAPSDRPAQGRDLFFPCDEGRWLIARHFVQVADAVHGDVWSHLVQSHFAANPMVLTTKRTLDSEHPLRQILEPHMQFTLWVNNAFLGKSAQGLYSALMPFDREELHKLITRAWRAWDFTQCGFREDLRARGVDDAAILPDYPYRDDGEKFVTLLEEFATRYVDARWSSDAAVEADVALKNWVTEITAPPPHGGDLRLPGAITTRAALADVLARLLVHLGPGHASVHSPALAYAAYAPNMASYSAQGVSAISAQSELTDFLPPTGKIMRTFILHYGISEVHWGQFVLDDPSISDPAARRVAREFDGRLARLDGELSIRDAVRQKADWMGYPFMRPSRVPNSIYA